MARCRSKGIEVILDDRDERAGVKFNDADLIGIPTAGHNRPQAPGRKGARGEDQERQVENVIVPLEEITGFICRKIVRRNSNYSNASNNRHPRKGPVLYYLRRTWRS